MGVGYGCFKKCGWWLTVCPKIICLSEEDLFCQIFSEFYICSDFCDPSINLFSSTLTDRTTNRLGWGNSAQKVARFGGTNPQIETKFNSISHEYTL